MRGSSGEAGRGGMDVEQIASQLVELKSVLTQLTLRLEELLHQPADRGSTVGGTSAFARDQVASGSIPPSAWWNGCYCGSVLALVAMGGAWVLVSESRLKLKLIR